MAHASGTIAAVDYATAIRTGRHALTADEGPALGGRDAGPAPYDLLCCALCACTAITLRMYAQRKQWPLESAEIDVRFKREGERSWIERVLKLQGALSDEQRARLADIAERTPVTLTLKSGLAIQTRLG